jgi:type VI secretion system protein ImpC
MTESVQKKLLRVRPPRVKITYDVETGGAIEKKELPFIVGIFADLKGSWEEPDTLVPLKKRSMIDIDRDNFNDVMATILPRVDLKPVSPHLSGNSLGQVMTFSNIDAFEPMKVIDALPSLKSLHNERSQIRDLQSNVELDDALARPLDALIDVAQLRRPAGAKVEATSSVEAKTNADPPIAAVLVTDTADAINTDAMEKCATQLAKISSLNAETWQMTLAPFVKQMNLYFSESDAPAAARMTQAKQRGAIAVIDELLAVIDKKLSSTLSAVMHCPGFKQMEATWRGLHYLVMNTETSTTLKLRVFHATKEELHRDMMNTVEFDQSTLFKLIYEAEYGTYGGYPYSLLVGDYAFGNSDSDLDFLGKIAEVAAGAHAPFIAQASQELYRLSGFDQLDEPPDFKETFESHELNGWNAFREMEHSRYVTLTLPRVLLRLPYGAPGKRNATPCEGVNFDEEGVSALNPIRFSKTGEAISYADPEADHLLWGNPAYLLAERITNAFSLYNWTGAICGVEGGGLVEGLPSYTDTTTRGATELFCPTELSISDRREKELSDMGFISLCHCKDTGKAAFFCSQTTNLQKKHFSDSAIANAKISAMLPYMLAASRFAHYIKVIMREKIGGFLTRGNVESYLNAWIANYVLLDDNASQEAKAAYPLREACVVVTDVPGEPGCYRATVFLKPHFQLEELAASIRLVANLPS